MAKTYNSSQVIVTIDGIPIEGMADGDFFGISQNSPRHTYKVGADGDVTRSRSADRTARATITVMQGSNGSVILDGYKKKGDAGDDDTFTLDVIDVESGGTVSSGEAWIAEEPDWTRGLEAGTEAWILDMAENDIERGAYST